MDWTLHKRLAEARAARMAGQYGPTKPGTAVPAPSDDPSAAPSPSMPSNDEQGVGQDDLNVIDLRRVRAVRAAVERAAIERAQRELELGAQRHVYHGNHTTVRHASRQRRTEEVLSVLSRRKAVVQGEPLRTSTPLDDHCPACRGRVRLDVFDMVNGVAHMTCVDCGFLYTAVSPNH